MEFFLVSVAVQAQKGSRPYEGERETKKEGESVLEKGEKERQEIYRRMVEERKENDIESEKGKKLKRTKRSLMYCAGPVTGLVPPA